MNRMIPGDGEVFVIAETANAHEGDSKHLRRLIDAAAETKADAVKVHVYSVEERAVPESQAYDVCDVLSLSRDDWRELLPYAQERGLDVVADVFGLESAELLDKIGISGFKVHAADITNEPLLEYLGGLNRPVSLYVGGVTKIEIAEALSILRRNGASHLSLMYGLQNFPTSIEDSQLRRLQALKSQFDLPVGYASHVDGDSKFATELPSWAVAAGADIIEAHLTLDRQKMRTDYHSSLNPERFDRMVRSARTARIAAGSRTMELTDAESAYREDVKKTLVTTEDIEPGEQITEEKVDYLSTDESTSGKPIRRDDVLGKKASDYIDQHAPITLEQVEMTVTVVLPCRSESTRLYGKPLQLVGEKPILKHILDRVRRVKAIDNVVIAAADTPSQHSFANFANRHDLQYVVGSEPDVLQRTIDAGEAAGADVVIRAMTENPYIHWQNLDSAIEKHVRENADLTVTEGLPLGSFVDIHSMRGLRQSHEYGEDRHRSENTSLYILENPDSFHICTISPPEHLQRPDVRLTIDNPKDLILARGIYAKVADDFDDPIPLSAILDVIDSDPELAETNNEYPDGRNPDIKDSRPFIYGDRSEA